MTDDPPQPAPFPQPTFKPYPILITDHARQRHVERVSNPGRYDHLDTCPKPGCPDCVSLIYEVRGILRAYRRDIDRTIAANGLRAIQQNERVSDYVFLNAVAKRFPKDSFKEAEYYYSRESNTTAIYVIKREPDGRPVVVTILTPGLLDGMVLMTAADNRQEMQKVFSQWKRQTRMGV